MSQASLFSKFTNLEYWAMEGYWNKNGDPRVRHLPFMGSFRASIAILACYVLFVLLLGPRWMRNRKAFGLKTTLLCYNMFMCVVNGYFFVRMLLNYRETFYRMIDMQFPTFDAKTEWDMEIIVFNYMYVVSKYIDLLDTVFFVLRKKQSQITALHFYHHFSVAFFSWITLRLQAIANVAAPFAFMNSFIHVLMYSYYALASLGPAMQPYLWWKRYLTQLQIGQFLILFVHSIYFVTTQQGYSAFYVINYGLQTTIYIILFTRFYLQTYSRTKKAIHTNVAQVVQEKLIKSQ